MLRAFVPGFEEVTEREALFTAADYDDVQRFFESRPDLTPTPLVHLRQLAAAVRLSDILVKDESTRFGLNAFKIVGVAYAVDRLLRSARSAPSSPRRPIQTLVCATEGNHGRAVARVAREHGLRALVYMRRSAASQRVAAIRAEGADVVLVDGTYDDAVRKMAGDADRTPGMTIVSDTAWPGYEEIPRAIMAGYTWIMTEAQHQWGSEPPGIVAVQAGVGGLAGAVASWLNSRGGVRPYFICAEPRGAACVAKSIAAGHPAPLVPGDTIMAGLRCGEVSIIALPVLAATVDACIAVDDEEAVAAIQQLGDPIQGDPPIDAGPSGACGLAALLKLKWKNADVAAPGPRAFVINTEGAADRRVMLAAGQDAPHTLHG